MNTAKDVDALIEQVKQGGIPLSDAAWQVACACVGYPYVFGAWGEECTPNNRKRRVREDHPTIVSKCQVLSGRSNVCVGCQWDLPVRMFDCRGFTDWILKQFGIDLKGEGATSQWNTESNWKAKGEVSNGVPDNVLVCLFVKKGSKMEHTGIGYKGETCECSSGVQHFMKRNKKWTHWAIPMGIDGDISDYRPTLKRGSKGEYVTLLQTKLIQLGYDLSPYGADGKFGNTTLKAVKQFQKDNGLVADGVVGLKSWEVLNSGKTTLYTVTIQHVGLSVADEIVKKYGGTMVVEG